MRPSGWIFMAVSWTTILFAMVFAYAKILARRGPH